MKINLFLILCSISLFGCGQDTSTSPKKLLYKPSASNTYEMVLTSEKLSVATTVECFYETGPDGIHVRYVMKKIQYDDGGSLDKEMNNEAKQYINSECTHIYDSLGRMVVNLNREDIVNTAMMMVEFPGKEIKVGDTWQVKRSAKPELLFDTVVTKYTCKKITAGETTLDVVMNFVDNDKKTNSLSLAKKYTGNYVVSNATGTVNSAKLQITGFNGLSTMKGSIEIKKMP